MLRLPKPGPSGVWQPHVPILNTALQSQCRQRCVDHSRADTSPTVWPSPGEGLESPRGRLQRTGQVPSMTLLPAPCGEASLNRSSDKSNGLPDPLELTPVLKYQPCFTSSWTAVSPPCTDICFCQSPNFTPRHPTV